MKSYKNLWTDFISDENIILAIWNASKYKRNRKEVQRYLKLTQDIIDEIRYYAEYFENANHKPIEIYDGISRKKRTILVPTFKEQIIHHMVVQILQPMFYKGMYEHSYGSIPKRGCHLGKFYISKCIKNDTKNVKYCAKMDIQKFFPSIPHDILKSKICKYIRDEKMKNILYTLIV